ncbi:MAG TPA: DsbA family protein [Candidatus Limnocylindrales bacterium]|nr:DsbA family protein [Candidatus Limnocylindrales bacterium]
MDPLRSDRPLIVYIDFKSPYAFIAVQPTYEMAGELGICIDWRPLTLDIPSFAGSARLDRNDQVLESERSQSQWSWVKYAYRDARRYARLRGWTLRGTIKIWDTTVAGMGLEWAKRHGDDVTRRYIETTYERFWKRELDVEDIAVVESVLSESGAELAGFRQTTEGGARQAYLARQEAIFDAGIFGVPGYVVDGEYYWGREHLPRIRWILTGRRGPSPDIAYTRMARASA